MKSIVTAMTFSLMIASSAAAGSITFYIPNLHFPPKSPDTVTQDCMTFDTTEDTCEGAQ